MSQDAMPGTGSSRAGAGPPKATPLVALDGVEKRYGTRPGVKDLTLVLDRPGVVGLLGPNGSGKTTTLRLIAGILPPTRGTVHVLGRPATAPAAGVLVGYVPESPPLYPEMTVGAYLGFVARLRGMGRASDTLVDKVIHDAGLQGTRDRRIGTLSRGYRQRVSLAQGIVHDPRVLLLDEPTTGLDPDFAVEMAEVIARLGADRLVILSTHILSEVERLAQRVAILHAGRLIARWDLAGGAGPAEAAEAEGTAGAAGVTSAAGGEGGARATAATGAPAAPAATGAAGAAGAAGSAGSAGGAGAAGEAGAIGAVGAICAVGAVGAGLIDIEVRAGLEAVRAGLGDLPIVQGPGSSVDDVLVVESSADASRTRLVTRTRARADEAVRRLALAGLSIERMGPRGWNLTQRYLDASRRAQAEEPSDETGAA